MLSVVFRCVALSLLLSGTGTAVPGQNVAPASAIASGRHRLIDRLDSLSRAALAEFPLAGVSVLVVSRGDTLLQRAYGMAELSFDVPATSATHYRLIGPNTVLLAASVLRAAEQGLLSLEDDAARYLPEFPWQGRRVTIRQLLDGTSGLQDYHYLGDAYQRVARTPMRTDEVTALFAGRPFVHEPGAAWSWTISGFHLAGVILERVTGMPYPEYLERAVLAPAGLSGIVHCDGRRVTPDLARGYIRLRGEFGTDVVPTVSAVRFINSHCGTAAAVGSIAERLRKLLRPADYRALVTPEGAATRINPQDPLQGFGMGVTIRQEDGRKWWGTSGNLMGYGASWLNFAPESLTVVVLTNTQAGVGPLGRDLARAVLGLPLLPRAVNSAPLPGASTTAEERQRVLGLYRVELTDPPSQFRGVRESVCIYQQAGQLLAQDAGGMPFVLLKVGDGTFVGADNARVFRFFPRDGDVVGATLENNWVAKETAIRESVSCLPGQPDQ